LIAKLLKKGIISGRLPYPEIKSQEPQDVEKYLKCRLKGIGSK